jgi:hypothetical protein
VHKRFTLQHEIGSSCCTAVQAIDQQTGDTVVIKIGDREMHNQLQRENYILKTFLSDCPGVPTIVHYEVLQKHVISVQKPLGTTLGRFVEHLHRDIKPSNMIVAESGMFIIDFGIAATVEAVSSGFIGTREFASQNAIEEGDPVTAMTLNLCASLCILWKLEINSGNNY